MGEKRKREEGNMEIEEQGKASEDYCFVCKDGGFLTVCDHKECVKAYHLECVGKKEDDEEDNNWICEWHSCLVCRKSPEYQCYCCPNAVCQRCYKDAAFARVRGNKGFCHDCVRLALLGEEGMDVDSDGEKVDFKDSETYECLFKEYWDIIKAKEGLIKEDLQNAYAQIKKSKNYTPHSHKSHSDSLLANKTKCDSEKYVKEKEEKKEHKGSYSDNRDIDDVVQPIVEINKTKPKRAPRPKRKVSERIEFVGWASKSLMDFLVSIEVDASKELSQHDVASLVIKYVQDKNLLHPDKNKVALCDGRLRSLLGLKLFDMHKINEVLEPHFAENLEQWEDEGPQCRKKGMLSFQNKDVVKVVYSHLATVVPENMKLVYLRRTLVEELLEHHETFESKVVGSFVKVKSNPFDSKLPYHLLPVTGVKEISGDGNKEKIHLQVCSVANDIPISSLSNDDDISQEDCDNLRQKIDNGLVQKPTVVELEEKAKGLRKDITKHWITRELSSLQNRIELANEKGRRAELYECRKRRELLQSEEEQARLLNEVPKVIADVVEIIPEEPQPDDNPKDVITVKNRIKELKEKNLLHGDRCVVLSLPANRETWCRKLGVSRFQNRGSLVKKNRQKEVKSKGTFKKDTFEKVVYSHFASVTPENLKIVYLRRSLVEQLLEYHETFESKVVGSFVKVKTDSFDSKHPYHLLPVIGVKKDSGDGNKKKILFQVSSVANDIPISSLSNDDDISQEDCDNLRQRIDNGLVEKPTVVELEEKAKCLHEDITKHWITRELSILQNRIDVANEKGKRAKLCEYRKRRELLESEEEQARLLNEVPKVIPDVVEIIPEEPQPDDNPENVENPIQEFNEKLPEEWMQDNDASLPIGSLMDKLQQTEAISEELLKKDAVVYSHFATVTPKNMKIVYLSRSLVEKLLEYHETFESKVVGSFVKVKSNPFDSKHPYNLLPVVGVKKVSGDENNIKILLQVSSVANDIPVSSLSNDDDISQEDCDNLRQKVEAGLVEKPTVVELEEKAKCLHEDITKHWIARELLILQSRIDLANEKGRRAELYEYRKRRQLLQSEKEQVHLLNEMPKVIADVVEIKPEEPQPDVNVESIISVENPFKEFEEKLPRECKESNASLLNEMPKVIADVVEIKPEEPQPDVNPENVITNENPIEEFKEKLPRECKEGNASLLNELLKVRADVVEIKPEEPQPDVNPENVITVENPIEEFKEKLPRECKEGNASLLNEMLKVRADVVEIKPEEPQPDVNPENVITVENPIEEFKEKLPSECKESNASLLNEMPKVIADVVEIKPEEPQPDVNPENVITVENPIEEFKEKLPSECKESNASLLNEMPKVIADVVEIKPEEPQPDVNPENVITVENPIEEFKEKLPRECKEGDASLLNEMLKVIADVVEIKPEEPQPDINPENVITVENPIEEFKEKLPSECKESNASLLNEMPKVIADVVEIKPEEPQPDVNPENVITVENPIEEFKEKLPRECKEGDASLLNEMLKVIADVVEIKPEEPQPDVNPENVITVENPIEEFKEKLPRECKEGDASLLNEMLKVIADVVEIKPEEPQPDVNPENVITVENPIEEFKEKLPSECKESNASLLNEMPKVIADVVEIKPEEAISEEPWWRKNGMSPFQQKEAISEEPLKKDAVVYSHFATVVPENMRLVYLRRTLVEQLLEFPQTFESKVVGSFVKVKSEPFDSKHPYHLLPVIGVKKVSGDGNKEKILFQVSSVANDVPIASLSNDDDVSQEYCDKLHQKVENGLVEKPTVVELEEKAKCLHEDITKHWITKELSILCNRIDLANEKGRRAELYECRKRRELLQSKKEQARLLNEVPKVIADVVENKREEPQPDDINVENANEEFMEEKVLAF